MLDMMPKTQIWQLKAKLQKPWDLMPYLEKKIKKTIQKRSKIKI